MMKIPLVNQRIMILQLQKVTNLLELYWLQIQFVESSLLVEVFRRELSVPQAGVSFVASKTC